MSLENDVVQLQGFLELYDWIQNYDKKKVPDRKSLFLIVKKKLNLFLINKKDSSTPKPTTNKKYKFNKSKNEEFSSEKCDRSIRTNVIENDNDNSIACLSNDYLNLNVQKNLRPSTYCSIYPVSTFSKIHSIIENNNIYEENYNIKSRNIKTSTNKNKVNECPEHKNKIEYSKYLNENTTETDYNCEDDYSHKEKKPRYKNKIDIESFNLFLIYIEKILKTRINNEYLFETTENYQNSSNFCFLTFWKKIEEILNIQQSYEFNDETFIWQQLRDVLLLTGMSLKYPTWSGEQLSNIITRIIPKKGLSVILKTKEFVNTKNNFTLDMLNEDMNEVYSGLISLYFTFYNNLKTVFDLSTVSKLIQDNIKIYVNKNKENKDNKINNFNDKDEFKNNCNDKIIDSRIDSDYDTSNEYECDFDVDDDYVSLFEPEDSNIYKNKKINIERGVELVNNLGLFANINDIERIVDNSNYLFNTCKSNTSINETDYVKTSDEFEYQIFESTKNISENMINLGISKKLIEEIIVNHFSTENSKLEKKVLKDVCNIIEDSINNSNIIVSYVNENYVESKRRGIYKTIKYLFILVLLLIGLFVYTENNEAISNIVNYGKSATAQVYRLLTEDNLNSSSTNSIQNEKFNNNNNNNNMIKSTDCILKKWDNININVENNSICNAIGDITVIQKCFTNIDKIKSIQ